MAQNPYPRAWGKVVAVTVATSDLSTPAFHRKTPGFQLLRPVFITVSWYVAVGRREELPPYHHAREQGCCALVVRQCGAVWSAGYDSERQGMRLSQSFAG